MKTIYRTFHSLCGLCLIGALCVSCSDFLDEHTPQGVLSD